MAVSIPVPLGKGSEEDMPLEGPGGPLKEWLRHQRDLSEMVLACPSLQILKAKPLDMASTGHRAHFKKRSRPSLHCGRVIL